MSVREPVEAQQALAGIQARFQIRADAASDWLREMDEELRITYIIDGVTQFSGGVDPSIYYGKAHQEVGIPDRHQSTRRPN